MSDGEVHSRLCSLIYDSLRPYVEVIPTSFSKENVKDLLIALSQVCSKIKRWTLEFESDSGSDSVESDSDTQEVTANSAKVGLVLGSEAESHHSLAKAISVLMGLLAIENPYVQHLVGNILVAIADFKVASGSSWDEFMQLLSLLKLAAASSFPSSTGCIVVEAKNSCCNSEASVSLLNPHHKSAEWLTVDVIVQVLRRILKNLKQDADDHFFKLYLGLANSFISNMPWDLLDQVFVSQTSKASEDPNADGLLQFQPAKSKSAIMFFGNFIQFLNSLVDKSIPIEAVTDDLDKHPLLCEISNILPRLLGWCLGNLQNSDNVYISKYYKHKLLA